MTTITITISIDSDDARVTVAQNGGARSTSIPYPPSSGGSVAYVPPFADELVPLPEGAIPLPGDPVQPVAFRGAAMQNPNVCPVHLVAWKEVPAGVSKKSGKSYSAFRACPTQGCDQRPQ